MENYNLLESLAIMIAIIIVLFDIILGDREKNKKLLIKGAYVAGVIIYILIKETFLT